jgi:DNA-binding GntR family transcriptional regulator
MAGELAAGSQLKEEELATTCGVSRTPVREALRRLEAEMFIRRNDSQRTFVADWSLEDVSEMFTLRGMLEAHAASRAAARITKIELERLAVCNARIEKAVGTAQPDVEAFLSNNANFHGIVLEAAGSERLSTLLARLVEQPVVVRTALLYDREQLRRSAREHSELLIAFRKRDPEWAAAVMRGHIRRAFHAFAETYVAPTVTGGE